MIELLHFLLGAKVDPSSIFRSEQLAGDEFSLTLDVKDAEVTIRRSTDAPNSLVAEGIPPALLAHLGPRPLLSGAESSEPVLLDPAALSVVLGQAFFRLPAKAGDLAPGFRSLVSYFVRRVDGGGFTKAHMFFAKQPLWQQQVNMAVLLGFDWHPASEMARVTKREKLGKALKKEIESDAKNAGQVWPSSGKLRTDLTLKDGQVRRLREALRDFRVVEQYHDLEREANQISEEIASLTDDNSYDLREIGDVEQTLAVEAPPDSAGLERVYREAGLLLPSEITKRFEDVRAFHESVIRNRQTYLANLLNDLRDRVAKRQARLAELDVRRAQLLGILRTSGALETFTELQDELARASTEAETLRQDLKRVLEFERTTLEIKGEKSRIGQQLATTFEEHQDQLSEAIQEFAAISARLYESPGELQIRNRLQGPPITIEIPRKKSEGIKLMQVFCFDMTLMRLCRSRQMGPGFLVHDSHIFDGVDERQIRHALEVAVDMTKDTGWQYIVTMNSDIAESLGPDILELAIEPRLSDLEGLGLFGKSFDAPENDAKRRR